MMIMGLIDVGWEEESFPSNEDLLVLPIFALFFPIVRFLLDRLIFEKLARRYVASCAKGAGQDEQNDCRKRHIKFEESAWKCIYYLSAEIFAIVVTYHEPWFTNTQNFWIGPGNQVWPDQKVKTKLKALYMYTAGFYTYGIFALIFWETRRSDFGVSMSHHVATLILIILSYLLRFARVGSIVLALHDATDVFLEIGKMFTYSGSNIIPSISFIIFVIAWMVLRLIYHPFWILWSTSYEVLQTLDKEKHKIEGPIYYYTFNTLLYCLLVLHIYWWVLMYRMLARQIKARGKLGEDVRSDSEGEDKDD